MRSDHFGQIDRVRGDDAADAERAQHRQYDQSPEVRGVGERPEADAGEQRRADDGRPPAVSAGDPTHQVGAEQDPETHLQSLDHRVLGDADQMVGAPDERIEPRADAVGVDDDEAPGDFHQDRQIPLHPGQRQAIDTSGDMTMHHGLARSCVRHCLFRFLA